MVAIKANQAPAFLGNPDQRITALLFFGTDPGQVTERAEHASKAFAARSEPAGEIVRLDDDALADDPDRLAVELQTMPMFGGRKVIRAVAGRRLDGKLLRPFVDGGMHESFLVVEAGNLTPAAELRTLFEKSPVAAAVACYGDEGRDLGALIQDVLQGFKQTIDPAARDALAARLGADRALSRNEVEKLALYAMGRAHITLDDVEAVVGDAAALALDQIVNAAASGHTAQALKEADRLVAAGDSPQAIIAALQRHFVRLHRLRALADGGQSLETVIRSLRPPLHFKMQPAVIAQCRAWPLSRLTQAVAGIEKAAMEARLNNSLETPLTERLILNLCALAKRGTQPRTK